MILHETPSSLLWLPCNIYITAATGGNWKSTCILLLDKTPAGAGQQQQQRKWLQSPLYQCSDEILGGSVSIKEKKDPKRAWRATQPSAGTRRRGHRPLSSFWGIIRHDKGKTWHRVDRVDPPHSQCAPNSFDVPDSIDSSKSSSEVRSNSMSSTSCSASSCSTSSYSNFSFSRQYHSNFSGSRWCITFKKIVI